MKNNWTSQILRSVALCLLGGIGIGLLTFVCFRLHIGLIAVAILYLTIVVLLSIAGGFAASIFTSVLAVLCLDYFFTAPLFSLQMSDPLEVVALIAFLSTGSAVSLLMLQRQRFQGALRESEQRHRADQAEQALHEAQLELARVTRVMTLGEMTASIAHEINQPLAGVVTNGQAALRWLGQDPPRLEEVRSAVQRIIRDGNRASDVIARIRAIAKKTDPQKLSLDINDVIQQGIGLVGREVLRRGVSLRTEFAPALPPVIGDRVQLEQVIINLMINGAEAMASVTDRPREILIRSQQEGDFVLVAVRDAGIGIESGNTERVFSPLHHQAGRHGNGAVDQPVDHHGARRSIVGLAERGSWRNFSVHVASIQGRRVVKKKTDAVVFVVDDDSSIRESLSSLIRSVGLSVETFETAQDFMENERPDVPACVVLDVRLPGLSGLDLQRELAAHAITLPIIFITGHGDIPMTVQAMKAGALEFLTKPFRDQDLLDAIQEAIERDRASRQQRSELAQLRERFDALTSREREVLDLVAAGLLNKQIAGELGVSEITVKIHRGQVMKKMGAGSLAELVRMTERLGIPVAKD